MFRKEYKGLSKYKTHTLGMQNTFTRCFMTDIYVYQTLCFFNSVNMIVDGKNVAVYLSNHWLNACVSTPSDKNHKHVHAQ